MVAIPGRRKSSTRSCYIIIGSHLHTVVVFCYSCSQYLAQPLQLINCALLISQESILNEKAIIIRILSFDPLFEMP